MKDSVSFRLNGKPVRLEVDGDRKLLWVLRTDLGLTGTKYGCGESLCGACTVVVDREAVRSCQLPIKDVRGKDVTTIEGLAQDGRLHPLQEAFVEHGGLQCGFCTPGMIMNAYALLLKNPKPTRSQIVAGMDDNLCRCGAHNRIVQAIERAAASGEARHEQKTRPTSPRRRASRAGRGLRRRRLPQAPRRRHLILFIADLSDLLGQETRTTGYPTDFNAYLRIGEDGRVTVYSGKIEMGQGIVTSLAQMAADELDVALSHRHGHGRHRPCPWDMGTFGSMTTRFFGPALRAAAAEAKAVLLRAGRRAARAPKEELRVEDGVVFVAGDRGERVTLRRAREGAADRAPAGRQGGTKAVSEFSVMGRPVAPRRRAKVTGKAQLRRRHPPARHALRDGPAPAGPRRHAEERGHLRRGARAGRHRGERGRPGRRAARDPEAAEKALAAVKADFDVPDAGVRRRDHLRPPPRSGGARARSARRRGDLAEGEKPAVALFERPY